MSATIENLESALAGESMAHVKYRYFAQIARSEGFDDIARHFEETANQEIKHAWGHLELLIGTPSTKECLEKAIEGETYEYQTMYPGFKKTAMAEGLIEETIEMEAQENESREHAMQFIEMLKKAEKRFAALAKVEQRHADAYRQKLSQLES